MFDCVDIWQLNMELDDLWALLIIPIGTNDKLSQVAPLRYGSIYHEPVAFMKVLHYKTKEEDYNLFKRRVLMHILMEVKMQVSQIAPVVSQITLCPK